MLLCADSCLARAPGFGDACGRFVLIVSACVIATLLRMKTPQKDELIGRIYRHKTEDRQRLAFIEAELSDAAQLFKKAASQLEALLDRQRSELEPVLAKLDIDRVLQLVAEREQIFQRFVDANEQLRRLGVRA